MALRTASHPLSSSPVAQDEGFAGIIGSEGGMAQVIEQVRRVLGQPVHVLIEGESGTGKEVIARALHDRDPCRWRHSFVPVNCAAIPESLVEAELFGFHQGAFTGALKTRDGCFQQADGGTLFLDEIGEFPLSLQPKLLRVLQEKAVRRLGEGQERCVDVRVVAATSKDLGQAMAAGGFRPDLYYRLAEYPIILPPLRQRRQDIVPLAHHFLVQYRQEFGKPGIGRLSPAATARLQAHDWARNNVRELSRALKQAVLLCDGPAIEPEHLSLADPARPAPLKNQIQRIERGHMEEALTRTNGNIAAAARLLGMSRSTLFDRLRKLDIRRQRTRCS